MPALKALQFYNLRFKSLWEELSDPPMAAIAPMMAAIARQWEGSVEPLLTTGVHTSCRRRTVSVAGGWLIALLPQIRLVQVFCGSTRT